MMISEVVAHYNSTLSAHSEINAWRTEPEIVAMPECMDFAASFRHNIFHSQEKLRNTGLLSSLLINFDVAVLNGSQLSGELVVAMHVVVICVLYREAVQEIIWW